MKRLKSNRHLHKVKKPILKQITEREKRSSRFTENRFKGERGQVQKQFGKEKRKENSE
ncbi:Protein CBG25925 [Caenorhabditis briggsae]|uniref:Protein CBG25925 n=1 Tax=Caenorhabditis briggsae TaxID=6238 RepID=B6IK57_CAEBR|nr:Protein CBG25925 [Caenorhabditis briggsae]CAS00287.1 Protein CBG25925 [Caenorhabditis briggsae]